jgi:hypothetical protein
LARIAGRRTTQSLLGALQIVEDDVKIGVLGDLARRGDEAALRFLAAFAAAAAPVFRPATFDALARSPTPDRTVQSRCQTRRTRRWGMLAFGETLIDAGQIEPAAEAFRRSRTPPPQCG